VDAGRSAYHGRHRDDKAALGRFLECVREGKVPRGSFLIIENLDRLSREDERTALRLWLDILDGGVSIVQLHPETIFRHERSEMVDIIRAIIELSRGHSESRMKSVRALASWDVAVRRAREGGSVITRRLPSWVGEAGGVLALVPERAAVVRRIFGLATAGLGAGAIVKRLKADNVPAFGDRVPDENGGHRKVDGRPLGCGEWRTSYVCNILSDRRAAGWYQPRDSAGQKVGEPIPDYYPRAVSDEEFYAARAAVAARRLPGQNRQGRAGDGVPNLFGGLLRHARDGDTYYVATRYDSSGANRILLNRGSVEQKGRAFTFAYSVFERSILKCLREINPAEITGPPPPDAQVSVLQNELNWHREQRAVLAMELMKSASATIADAIRQHEAREAELAAKIDEGTEMAVVPRSDAWRAMHDIVDVLDETPEAEREDLRLRLRGAIRRTVATIWLLIVPRGRRRLLAAQVFFADGRGQRSYLVSYKAGWGSGHAKGEAEWEAAALDPEFGTDLDLRKADHARRLEAALLAADLEDPAAAG
jgi:DNA invertase Pin-like site-specific DNA recombinase